VLVGHKEAKKEAGLKEKGCNTTDSESLRQKRFSRTSRKKTSLNAQLTANQSKGKKDVNSNRENAEGKSKNKIQKDNTSMKIAGQQRKR